MKKKLLGVSAAMMALVLLLGSCTTTAPTATPQAQTEAPTTAPTTATPATQAPGTETPATEAAVTENVLNIAEATALTTLSPHNANASVDYDEQPWVTAGLYELVFDTETQRNAVVCDVAKEMPVGFEKADVDPASVGGKELFKSWKIALREDCTFVDGTPINADAFIYSWKMLLDPKLANRNYSNMYNILNTGAYYAGECGWEDVGLQKSGEYEVVITLDNGYLVETGYQLTEVIYSFMQGIVHEATYEACFNADRTENTYGTSLDKFVSSGTYEITSWIDGSYMEYKKRDNAPLSDLYTADRITVKVAPDVNTRVQMFEAGEIDTVEANAKKFDDYPVLYSAYSNFTDGIFINIFNAEKPILADKNFRYSLFWGLDRVNLVKLAKSSCIPSPYQFDTRAIIMDPKDSTNYIVYRDTPEAKAVTIDGHAMTADCYDATLAKEYFDKAYEANGSKLVELEMQYSEGADDEKAWAEALQDHFQNLFGVDRFKISLRAVPITGLRENMYRTNGKYELAVSRGIYAIYKDPWQNTNWCYTGDMTYSTQYALLSPEAAVEWDTNFYKGWGGEWAFDAQKKFDLAVLLEQIQTDECTWVPAYDRANRWIISDKLTPILDGTVGDPELRFALLQAEYE